MMGRNKTGLYFQFSLSACFVASRKEVKKIFEEYFAKESLQIDVVNYGEGDDLLGEIMCIVPNTTKTRLIKFDQGQDIIRIKNSSLLIFDSQENFERSLRKLWLTDNHEIVFSIVI